MKSTYEKHYTNDLTLLSYNRFIEIKKRALIYLISLLKQYMKQAKNTEHIFYRLELQLRYVVLKEPLDIRFLKILQSF